MTPNPGFCPPEATGKRVRVRLANGDRPRSDWAADGRGGCRWSLTGDAHDIAAFEVVG